MSLTPNAIQQMFGMSGSSDNPSFLPTVQVLHLKKIDQKGGVDDRWKVRSIKLSEGEEIIVDSITAAANLSF